MRESNDFYEAVYELVRLIPYGRVTSYGAIARYLGASRSARMVGSALKAGLTDDLPAHRVVNRNGQLSGKHQFPADRPMAASLRAEGIPVAEDQVQDFETYFWDPGTLREG